MADEKKKVVPQSTSPHAGPITTDKDNASPDKVEFSAPSKDKAAPPGEDYT